MKKLLVSSLLIGTSLLADVRAPEVLTKNSFETSEFQVFVTNTRNVPITKDLVAKIVFEGEIEDYYKEYNKMVEQKFHTGEEITKRAVESNQYLGKAVYYKDIKSLQNVGIAAVGSVALNAMLGSVLGDDHASVFQEELGLKNINYKDISKNLKDGELYIDLANIDNEYLIFTLDNKNSINFEKISKEDFKIIEDSINEFRDINERFSNTAKGLDSKKISDLTIESKDKSSLIYDKLLNSSISIKNALNSADSLIISADGILRLLPFEALYDKNSSKYLIEDKNIRYIPSGKEFVRLYSNSIKNNEKQNNKISMFANPNFNDKNTKEKEDNNSEKLLTPNTSRSVAAEALFSMEQFSVLPNTKIEAINIKNILSNYKVDEYLENNASESNLFNISKPKILHIATHGFFINDNDIPNTMLKSGIVLSGANQSLKYSKDEGIVTSLKLSSLDLKSTQLVVLSACQTAEVDPNSSESVSGLNKAFIQAGANSVIMSLWAVADKETMELMRICIIILKIINLILYLLEIVSWG